MMTHLGLRLRTQTASFHIRDAGASRFRLGGLARPRRLLRTRMGAVIHAAHALGGEMRVHLSG
jgi:hypothetical protein